MIRKHPKKKTIVSQSTDARATLTRRAFCATGLGLAGAALLGPLLPGARGKSPSLLASISQKETATAMDLMTIPNFCAHEHWGSIDSIGFSAGIGFRGDVVQGALPSRRTNLIDLIADPYFGGHLASGGPAYPEELKKKGYANLQEMAQKEGAAAVMALMRPALETQALTGTYQCLRRGILHLYGVDIWSANGRDLAKLDKAVGDNYAHMFDWYREAMAKAHLGELIRPVHPEFGWEKQSADSAAKEMAFTHSLLRIDDFTGMAAAKNEQRDGLAERTQVDPVDAKSWREFIGRIMDQSAKAGGIGIKQLQAYGRSLDFPQPADGEVVFRGELTGNQQRAFGNWVVNECCKQANDRGWPHQIHVGTHNLPNSTPLPLQGLAQRYPKMKLVMLHCWPFLDEAGHIAKYVTNAYLDPCWLPVLNPAYLQRALAGWLQFVPSHKIMLSNDATSVEMAVGSSLYAREILGQTLEEAARESGLNASDRLRVAAGLLNNNAVAVYGIGKAM